MKSITSLALIILAVGVFFFYIDPEYKKVQALNEQIEKNKEILEIVNRLDTKKTELNTKFNQISQEEKKELEKLLPDTVDNIRLIIDIRNIADQFGLEIKDISIASKDQNTGEAKKTISQKSNFEDFGGENSIKYVDTSRIGVLSFSFGVSAKYEVFIEFLEELERSLRLLDIRSMEVTSGGGDSVFYNYRVTFDTYWLK
jgi:hypothetical protein